MTTARKTWRDKTTVHSEEAYQVACDRLGPHDKRSEERWERERNFILFQLYNVEKFSLRLLADASGYSATNVARFIRRHAALSAKPVRTEA